MILGDKFPQPVWASCHNQEVNPVPRIANVGGWMTNKAICHNLSMQSGMQWKHQRENTGEII